MKTKSLGWRVAGFFPGQHRLIVVAAAIPLRWWWLALAAGAGWWALDRHRLRSRPAGIEEVIAFGRLLVVPLSGGMSLPNALAMASMQAHPQLRREVSETLRRSRRQGLAPALAAGGGALGDLFGRMAGAHSSGASVARAVLAHVENLHFRQRMESLSRIRSLPVTLAVPLTLLIVPGFLLVLVGPTLVSRVAEMFGGLLGT